jgi:hypothetical protein
MKIYIEIKNRKRLPKMDELVEVMWKQDISLSRVGNQDSLRKGTYLTLSWDKWLDDERWKYHPNFKEYIYFDFDNRNLSIEVDDNACLLDLRAVYKAVEFIGKTQEALVKIESDNKWMTLEQYKLRVKRYLMLSFSEAVEKSLLEYKED